METKKIHVTTLTNHRIDVMLAEWLKTALLSMPNIIVENTVKDADIVCMFNGILTEDGQDRIDSLVESGKKVYYFYDDLDLVIPDNVRLVTQFYDLVKDNVLYFPIAELAVFDDKWDRPISIRYRPFTYLHGGTFKVHRKYTFAKPASTLILGDDKEWDKFKTHRLPTIRDMELYYSVQALCVNNLLLPDERYDDNCLTLRFFEGVFTNTNTVFKDSIFTFKDLKRITNKNKVKAELWNIIQQM